MNKIRAALDARTDPDFVIIARCDAYAVTGWEDTIRRCNAYVEAGADVVFVDGIKSEEDIRNYASDMAGLPRMYNGDLMNTNELNDLGYKITICGSTIWLIYQQVKDAFEELKATGAVDPAASPPAGTWRLCWALAKSTSWSASTASATPCQPTCKRPTAKSRPPQGEG